MDEKNPRSSIQDHGQEEQDWPVNLDGTDIANRVSIQIAIHRPGIVSLIFIRAVPSGIDGRAVPSQHVGVGIRKGPAIISQFHDEWIRSDGQIMCGRADQGAGFIHMLDQVVVK